LRHLQKQLTALHPANEKERYIEFIIPPKPQQSRFGSAPYVKAPDREYVESRIIASGREIVTAKASPVTLGLSICYDLRFPELYRLLALRGAEVLAIPAAFTLQTGKDHWELLLRARAVENQAYVIAPAQWGRKADGRWTYGRSVIVDPRGTVLTTCPDRDGHALAELDFDYLDRFRTEFPALTNRQPEAYVW
jgi:deaminated glutathione amidase